MDRIVKAGHGIGQAADLDQKKDDDQRLENTLQKIGMQIVFLLKIVKAKIYDTYCQKHQNYQKQCLEQVG